MASPAGGIKVNHNVTSFLSPWSTTAQTTSSAADVLTPATKFTTLTVKTSAGIAGGTIVVTVFQNDVASAMTCTVLASATTCSDTSHTLTFAAGDTFSVKVQNTSTTAGQDPNVSWAVG